MKSGWEKTSLGHFCTLISGRHLEPKDQNTESRGVGYLTGPADFGVLYPVISRWTESPLALAMHGDILITVKGAGVGKINLLDVGTAAISRQLMAIRVKDANPRFVFAFIDWQFNHFQSLGSGATVPGLSRDDVLDLRIPTPPLAEQRRIVGILDEAFDGIATAKANAEKNLRNARALFESHLNAVFVQQGEGWHRATLVSLLEIGWIESHLDGNHGGDYPRKEEFISKGVPYISANCLDDERVDMSRAKYLSPSRAALLRKGIAKNNDVLFAHNATVGPVAILRTGEEKVVLGTSLTYYRCNQNHILPEYLAQYMRSFAFKSQYLQVMRQSTRNQIPITKQREFYHIIPPIEEQKNIVVPLDSLREETQRLEFIYQQKLVALDELKKSLLHRAFRGEL